MDQLDDKKTRCLEGKVCIKIGVGGNGNKCDIYLDFLKSLVQYEWYYIQINLVEEHRKFG